MIRKELSPKAGFASMDDAREVQRDSLDADKRGNVFVNLWQLPADGYSLYNREFNILRYRAWLVPNWGLLRLCISCRALFLKTDALKEFFFTYCGQVWGAKSHRSRGKLSLRTGIPAQLVPRRPPVHGRRGLRGRGHSCPPVLRTPLLGRAVFRGKRGGLCLLDETGGAFRTGCLKSNSCPPPACERISRGLGLSDTIRIVSPWIDVWLGVLVRWPDRIYDVVRWSWRGLKSKVWRGISGIGLLHIRYLPRVPCCFAFLHTVSIVRSVLSHCQ